MVVGINRYKQTLGTAFRRGFALPTVLIASVVLLIVLTVSVSATTAVREALLTQYYDQLAQTAGEAGVAYAKACLSANGNKPTWTGTTPLTPQTDCTGTVVSGYPQYVMTNGDVRSTFSVGAPTTDANGFAVTIPNSGSVQLLRSSTGAVWKTYKQPNAQPAVVPDLCSGAATSDQGWNNAVITTTSATTSITGAQVINTSSSTSVNPGPIYYRKDFNITQAGTYTVKVRADDSASVWIDGTQVATTSGYNTVTTFSTSLSSGCHTMNVNLINGNYIPNPSNLTASVAATNVASPVMVTDTSWRWAAIGGVAFGAPNYYVDPNTWTTVRDMQPSYTVNGSWAATSGDTTSETRWISPSFGYDGSGNYPSSQYIAMQDMRTITVTTPIDVRVAYDCDDSCTILLDGNPIGNGSWNSVQFTNLTLNEGVHTFAIILYNGSGGMGAMLSVLRTSDNTMLTRTEANTWYTTTAYFASSPSLSSYDASYKPSPSPTKGVAYGKYLIVGGGGGAGFNAGGGGGGGGVLYNSNYQLTVGSASIYVGPGGTGSTTGNAAGSNGTSSYINSTYAYGGGAGASRAGGVQGQNGGSGGGGAGASATPRNSPGSGISGQGFNGGNGVTPDGGCNATGAGGGGAGGRGWDGANTVAGNGGPGNISWITGAPVIYGAGGAGGITCTGTAGLADPTAGTASTGILSGTANTGGGGGANGGNGGSGVVIIAFPTGSVSASASCSSGTYGTSTANGNTIYKFTSGNCTFTVSSVNI